MHRRSQRMLLVENTSDVSKHILMLFVLTKMIICVKRSGGLIIQSAILNNHQIKCQYIVILIFYIYLQVSLMKLLLEFRFARCLFYYHD